MDSGSVLAMVWAANGKATERNYQPSLRLCKQPCFPTKKMNCTFWNSTVVFLPRYGFMIRLGPLRRLMGASDEAPSKWEGDEIFPFHYCRELWQVRHWKSGSTLSACKDFLGAHGPVSTCRVPFSNWQFDVRVLPSDVDLRVDCGRTRRVEGVALKTLGATPDSPPLLPILARHLRVEGRLHNLWLA